MNGYELADEIKTMLADAESYYGEAESYLIKCETKLRQLQKERDLLFSAHSHEMKRADKLAVENEELKADNFTLAQTVSELTTIRGSSTLVPDDKLAEMQAEIEALKEPKIPLLDQEIKFILGNGQCWTGEDCSMPNLMYIIRAVEAAHGIGVKQDE